MVFIHQIDIKVNNKGNFQQNGHRLLHLHTAQMLEKEAKKQSKFM